ncbi:transposase, partial [Staphylococcus aureus]|uniref:transposase n=2 Tax=Staphylococcus aureus TaxID=1280 RepID=UPI0019642840
ARARLDEGFEDAFQDTVQGNTHKRQKRTNLIERLNQEVRRREKIIRIFPNQTSANRLIGAVFMDLHDEWIYSSRKYINFDK